MSIAVFIALQGVLSLVNVANSKEIEHFGDYLLVNELGGFSFSDLEELEADENIEAVAAMQFSIYEQNEEQKAEGILLGFDLQAGETFQVIGLNELYMEYFFGKWLSAEQMEVLLAGKGCVVRNPIPIVYQGEELPYTSFSAGDRIEVSGKELEVLYTLDGYDAYLSVGNSGFYNGVQVVVNEDLYTELTGKEDYAELLPVLEEGGSREGADLAVNRVCQRVLGSTCLSYEEADRQLEESFAQTNLLAWGLILLIGLIGVLNIINTVYTNIYTRVVEIGVQRAIGMSLEGIYRTFLWEGVYYGGIAALIGGGVGYLCLIFVEAAKVNEIGLIPFPLLAMAEAALVSILVCLAATWIPLWKIRRMNIVESMEAAE